MDSQCNITYLYVERVNTELCSRFFRSALISSNLLLIVSHHVPLAIGQVSFFLFRIPVDTAGGKWNRELSKGTWKYKRRFDMSHLHCICGAQAPYCEWKGSSISSNDRNSAFVLNIECICVINVIDIASCTLYSSLMRSQNRCCQLSRLET